MNNKKKNEYQTENPLRLLSSLWYIDPLGTLCEMFEKDLLCKYEYILRPFGEVSALNLICIVRKKYTRFSLLVYLLIEQLNRCQLTKRLKGMKEKEKANREK